MRGIKRLLILGVSVLTLFSTPVAAGASPVVERISVDQSETMKPGKLISEKTYEDVEGNPVTEKVYFTPNQSASAGIKSAKAITGGGTFKKELEFLIYTSKSKREKIRAYVQVTTKFINGNSVIVKCTGNVTKCPQGVGITVKKPQYTVSEGKFCFYSQSKFQKRRLNTVKISIDRHGAVH